MTHGSRKCYALILRCKGGDGCFYLLSITGNTGCDYSLNHEDAVFLNKGNGKTEKTVYIKNRIFSIFFSTAISVSVYGGRYWFFRPRKVCRFCSASRRFSYQRCLSRALVPVCYRRCVILPSFSPPSFSDLVFNTACRDAIASKVLPFQRV